MAGLFPLTAAVFFLSVACPHLSRAAYTIGVNYGTIADNLPPPSKVATFLKTKTTIDRVKIFHASPDILRAFAGTGIAVTVSVGDEDIVSLSKLPAAKSWVSANILPFYPKTLINRIAMGNEILATSDKTLIASLLPAMKALHSALQLANVTNVQVTTPNSLGILASSYPPSNGSFRSGFDRTIFAPILEFHRQTNSSFMVNPYPFFALSAENVNSLLNYSLFKPIPSSTFDAATGKNYTNMFDAQMDAVYSAMKKVGYEDVEIVVGETGWPSVGDPNQPGVSMENAESYNRNLVRHVNSGKGTPLMPNRKFETYIFALFNENKKPSTSERNYGLFKPDLTPVYDVGILRNPAEGPSPTSAPSPSAPGPGPTLAPSPSPSSPSAPSPSPSSPSPPSPSPSSPSPPSPSPSSPSIPSAPNPSGPSPPAPSPAAPSTSSMKKWCVPRSKELILGGSCFLFAYFLLI